MTQKDGDPHKIDYARMGFATLDLFLNPVLAGHPEDIVCHTSTVEPQSHTEQLLSLTSEPKNAQGAPDGTAPRGKFIAP